MKTIKVNLNSASVSNAIKRLQAEKKIIRDMSGSFISNSLDYVHKQAQNNLANNVDTGELINSFVKTINGRVGRISNVSRYAKYVEYGTGIVGANSQHPKANQVGWRYRQKGWVYFKNNRFFYTQGQTSKAFMFKAYLDYADKGKLLVWNKTKKEYGY